MPVNVTIYYQLLLLQYADARAFVSKKGAFRAFNALTDVDGNEPEVFCHNPIEWRDLLDVRWGPA